MALDTPFFGPDLLFDNFEKLNFESSKALYFVTQTSQNYNSELKDPSDSFLVKSNLDNPSFMHYTFYTV